ncbi:hypothetical protein BDR07DRAFT_1448041 [Suillus spraguei]|nr:hypothetical protein BDR07DRAFT_1448041 [Suillus spraguei]
MNYTTPFMLQTTGKPGPHAKTLFSIISSSVLTLFACVYTAIHPNIPSPKSSPRYLVVFYLGVTLAALVFPEMIVTWAMRQKISARHYTWTETHSFFLLMGGFMLYVDGKPYQTLRPDELIELIRAKCIEAPTLTADQIHDRSKGNAISKGLVILQVAWFIIQFIARVIYHLEITQLEVGTLAFAVLNFLTYAAWWHKPLNCTGSRPIQGQRITLGM